jgi:hypothetical protein
VRHQTAGRLWPATIAGRLAIIAVAVVLAGCGSSPSPASASPASASPASASPAFASPAPSVEPSSSVAADASPSAPTTDVPSAAPTPVAPSPPAASRNPTATDTPSPTPLASSATGLPAFRHVYLIIMENKEYGSIVGSSSAPYINGLIARYGLASRYDAVAHPSEPNYIALFSGSTQGVTDDGVHDLRAANLADQLEAHGRSWQVFAQNVPLGCFTGTVAHGGADGSGTYARKHEPAISFTSIASSPARCGRITDLSHFDPAAADFELIVPNMCNDMHDCSVATGDAFLAKFVPRITGSPAFADSVLFITWDEGTTDAGGGGHVPLLVVSPLVAPGTVSAVSHDHYSLLRTIEDAWGLGCLANTCHANDLRELFTR